MVKSYLRHTLTSLFGSSVHTVVSPVSFVGANGRPLLATCSSDVVHVWDLKTGQTATLWSKDANRSSRVTSLEIAVESGHLLTGFADGTIRAWNANQIDMTVDVALESDDAIGVFVGHSSAVTVMNCNDENGAEVRMCSGSASGELILWDYSSGAPIRRLSAHVNAVSGAVFYQQRLSSMGEVKAFYIVTSSVDGNIRVFDAETGLCVQTVPGTVDIKHLMIDRGEQYLIAGNPKEYQLFSIQQTEIENEVVAEIGAIKISGVSTKDAVIDLAHVGAESIVVVANSKSELSVFKLRSNEDARKRHRRKHKNEGGVDPVNGDATDHATNLGQDGGRTLKGDQGISLTVKDCMAKIATIKCDAKIHSLSCLRRRHDVSAAFDDGSLCSIISATSSGVETYRVVRSQPLQGNQHSSHLISLKQGAQDIVKGVTITAEGHQHEIGYVAVCVEEQIMSTGGNYVKTWDLRTGNCTLTVRFPTTVSCCAFASIDAKSGIACLTNGSIHFFDLRSGVTGIIKETAHEGLIKDLWTDVSGMGDYPMITCGVDGFIRYWDVPDPPHSLLQCVGEVKLPDEILCMRAECSEHMVLCAALMDCTVRCVDLKTNREKLSLYGHKLPVVGMDISSDGTILVTAATDKTVKVWGLEFGDCRRSFWCGQSVPRCVRFQPKTHLFFTGATDGVITYWDCDRLDSVAPLNSGGSSVRHLVVSSDGEILMSVAEDRMFRLWYRSDEQMFLEEEKENRLAETLEVGSKAAGSPEVIPARSEFDQLVSTLELCTSADDAKEVQLIGVSSEDYIAQALVRVPFGVLEREVSGLSSEHAGLLLMSVLSKITQQGVSTVSGELYSSTSLLLLKQFKGSLTEKLVDRSVLRRLYTECKAKLASCVDAVGFCQSALQMCAHEVNSQ